MKKQQSKNIQYGLMQVKSALLVAICFIVSLNGMVAQDSQSKELTIQQKIANLAWSGAIEDLKAIYEKDKGLVNTKLNNDETLLTIAGYGGNQELAKFALSIGIDVNSRNRWDMSPLLNAALSGNVEVGKLLIDKGADIEAMGGNAQTPLMFALQYNHPDFAKLLIEKGANVNVQNSDNEPAILYASWRPDMEIMKIMVERGADVNYCQPGFGSVIHNVSGEGSNELVGYLILKGANVNVTDQEGLLPLHIAIQNGNKEIVKLLAENSKDLNHKEKHFGNTPLHLAAINGDLDATRILVENGSDAKVTNQMGKSPIDYAIQYGYDELTAYYASLKLTDAASVDQARINRNEVSQKINNGDVRIWHTGHSGWVLQLDDKVLVMDYWPNGQQSPVRSLESGVFNPAVFKDKKVYVFVSHDHSDHFDTTIYAWSKQIKDIRYIYGFKAEESEIYRTHGYHGPSYVYIPDNQTSSVDDMTITTIKADDSGQGFLIETNGMTFFHAGDHADLNTEIEPVYKKEIDFLTEKFKNIDVAFLPVSGCPSSWERAKVIDGFFYAVDKLNPAQIYPMHALQREYDLIEFARLGKEKNYSNSIICVRNKGDHFLFNKSELVHK